MTSLVDYATRDLRKRPIVDWHRDARWSRAIRQLDAADTPTALGVWQCYVEMSALTLPVVDRDAEVPMVVCLCAAARAGTKKHDDHRTGYRMIVLVDHVGAIGLRVRRGAKQYLRVRRALGRERRA